MSKASIIPIASKGQGIFGFLLGVLITITTNKLTRKGLVVYIYNCFVNFKTSLTLLNMRNLVSFSLHNLTAFWEFVISNPANLVLMSERGFASQPKCNYWKSWTGVSKHLSPLTNFGFAAGEVTMSRRNCFLPLLLLSAPNKYPIWNHWNERDFNSSLLFRG